MANDLAKRFIKKDGSQRISFYREDYAENPRDTTDEPLHCEDWSRDYSIMTKEERESKLGSARDFGEYLLKRYGLSDKIIGKLKNNMDGYLNANSLVYNRRKRCWELMTYFAPYGKELGWWPQASFECKLEDIYMFDLIEELSDYTIFELVNCCLTDQVKFMSYNFGYYGKVSFYEEFDITSCGVAWLDKDEFLKYSGCKEEYWNGKSLKEIEWLLDEIKAWSEGEVYGFVVEDCIKSIINKRYTNVNKDDEEYEEVEWEETDSCCGFYGDIDKVKASMFDCAGLDINEFEEE